MEFSSTQIEQIARGFWGQPNGVLSTKGELRFGTHGSVSVDLKKCAWFDHEVGEGGDAFKLIKREIGGTDREVFAWLERNGFKAPDDRGNGNGADIPYDAATDPFKNFTLKKERKDRAVPGQSRIVKTWSYTDENGDELFEVCRLENGERGTDGKPTKSYRQRHKTPDGYVSSVKGIRQVPYRLPALIEAIARSETVFIVEGEKCADAIISLGGAATCNAMGAGKWPDALTPWFKVADVCILPDADEPGHIHASLVAERLRGTVNRVRLLELPDLPPKGDVVDWLDAGGTLEQLHALVDADSCEPPPHAGRASQNEETWPEPKLLPGGLKPVMAFDADFLPDAIAPWVMDIADRMQCPPDFVGIPAVIALGSVIGRKVAVRPQRKTAWYEVPNLWGCIVGRPGILKSPAMKEALKPLHRLEADARAENDLATKAYAVAAEVFKLKKDEAQKKGREAIKKMAPPTCLRSFRSMNRENRSSLAILLTTRPMKSSELFWLTTPTACWPLGNGVLANRPQATAPVLDSTGWAR